MPAPKLSKLELQIMDKLWTQGAASIREILDAFHGIIINIAAVVHARFIVIVADVAAKGFHVTLFPMIRGIEFGEVRVKNGCAGERAKKAAGKPFGGERIAGRV